MSHPPRKSLLRKRASRLAAAQVLYSEALMERKRTPAVLIEQLLQSWADSKLTGNDDLPSGIQPEQALLNAIVDSAVAHRERIERAIEALILPEWKKERMSLPLLSTLRACAAETLAFAERPKAVLIEEYTEVSAQLVTDEELSYAHKAFNLLIDGLRG